MTPAEAEDYIAGLSDGYGGYGFGKHHRIWARLVLRWPPRKSPHYERGYARGKKGAAKLRIRARNNDSQG